MFLKILILLTLNIQNSKASITDNQHFINCMDYCEVKYSQYRNMCSLGCRIKAHDLECYYCDRVYHLNTTKHISYAQLCQDGCNMYGNITNTKVECIVPSWVDNMFCYNRTLYDIDICCLQFISNNDCYNEYTRCLTNHNVSPLYFFEDPIDGQTHGYNLMTYDNLFNVSDCARFCLDFNVCYSFDYNSNYKNKFLILHNCPNFFWKFVICLI